MKKNAKQYLVQWKENANKRPLLVTGNLSYIKTKLLKDFGKEYYKRVLYLDLNTQPEWAAIFNPELSPERTIEIIGFLDNAPIDIENTLIILESIQDFPEVLQSLQQFALDSEKFHIIATNNMSKQEKRVEEELPHLIQRLHLESNSPQRAVAS